MIEPENRCIVRNCVNSRSSTSSSILFPLPNNENLAHRWLINCRRQDLVLKPKEELEKYKVCIVHFDVHMLTDSKDTLLPDSIPTIFCENEDDENQFNENMLDERKRRLSDKDDDNWPRKKSKKLSEECDNGFSLTEGGDQVDQDSDEPSTSVTNEILSLELRPFRVECPVRNCRTNSTNRKIRNFSLPKDTDRARLWLINCQREDLLKIPLDDLRSKYKVCGEHFEKSMYIGDICKRLHANAVPTIFNRWSEKIDTEKENENPEENPIKVGGKEGAGDIEGYTLLQYDSTLTDAEFTLNTFLIEDTTVLPKGYKVLFQSDMNQSTEVIMTDDINTEVEEIEGNITADNSHKNSSDYKTEMKFDETSKTDTNQSVPLNNSTSTTSNIKPSPTNENGPNIRKGSRCIVSGCNTYSFLKNYSLFSIPRDEKLAHTWLINCRRFDLLKRPVEFLTKACRVCGKHFESKAFLNDLRNRLHPNVVPTLFYFDDPQTDTAESEAKKFILEKELENTVKSLVDVGQENGKRRPRILGRSPRDNQKSNVVINPTKVSTKSTTTPLPVVVGENTTELTTAKLISPQLPPLVRLTDTTTINSIRNSIGAGKIKVITQFIENKVDNIKIQCNNDDNQDKNFNNINNGNENNDDSVRNNNSANNGNNGKEGNYDINDNIARTGNNSNIASKGNSALASNSRSVGNNAGASNNISVGNNTSVENNTSVGNNASAGNNTSVSNNACAGNNANNANSASNGNNANSGNNASNGNNANNGNNASNDSNANNCNIAKNHKNASNGNITKNDNNASEGNIVDTSNSNNASNENSPDTTVITTIPEMISPEEIQTLESPETLLTKGSIQYLAVKVPNLVFQKPGKKQVYYVTKSIDGSPITIKGFTTVKKRVQKSPSTSLNTVTSTNEHPSKTSNDIEPPSLDIVKLLDLMEGKGKTVRLTKSGLPDKRVGRKKNLTATRPTTTVKLPTRTYSNAKCLIPSKLKICDYPPTDVTQNEELSTYSKMLINDSPPLAVSTPIKKSNLNPNVKLSQNPTSETSIERSAESKIKIHSNKIFKHQTNSSLGQPVSSSNKNMINIDTNADSTNYQTTKLPNKTPRKLKRAQKSATITKEPDLVKQSNLKPENTTSFDEPTSSSYLTDTQMSPTSENITNIENSVVKNSSNSTDSSKPVASSSRGPQTSSKNETNSIMGSLSHYELFKLLANFDNSDYDLSSLSDYSSEPKQKKKKRNNKTKIKYKKRKLTIRDFDKLCDKYLMKANLSKFVKIQARLGYFRMHGRKYDDSYKEFAHTIYSLSPECYTFLQELFYLPAVSCIKKERWDINDKESEEEEDVDFNKLLMDS